MTRTRLQDIHLAIIGAGGHQASEFMGLYPHSRPELVAVDIDATARRHANSLGYMAFASISEMLANGHVDAAYVAVPHQDHAAIATQLLEYGVTVLEEKPFAVTAEEADALMDLSNRTQTPVFTTAQRPFRHTSLQLLGSLHGLGEIYSYSYTYSLSLPARTKGWRSTWSAARGGVMLDMAYHQLDLVSLLLGPQTVDAAQVSYCYGETRTERLEDSSTILTSTLDGKCTGQITTNRHAHAKSEQLILYGTEAVAVMDAAQLRVYNRDGSLQWTVDEVGGPQTATRAMYQEYLANRGLPNYWIPHMARHRQVVACLDQAYALVSVAQSLKEPQHV